MIRKIYASELPHRAIAVYLYLSDRANKEGICYPSIKTISRELNFSVSTVKRAIEDLVVSGYIEKKQRWRENGGRSSLLFKIVKQAPRGNWTTTLNHGIGQNDPSSEVETLRDMTEKKIYVLYVIKIKQQRMKQKVDKLEQYGLI